MVIDHHMRHQAVLHPPDQLVGQRVKTVFKVPVQFGHLLAQGGVLRAMGCRIGAADAHEQLFLIPKMDINVLSQRLEGRAHHIGATATEQGGVQQAGKFQKLAVLVIHAGIAKDIPLRPLKR
ncbi:MAG: hypothetical protein VR70_06790 [Rhodospirillaceae bacterium BRH_c57]|nr:MAG: hypothetical protein VR70_06790 [Rhodospirillaceae bacterium BRH_c57]